MDTPRERVVGLWPRVVRVFCFILIAAIGSTEADVVTLNRSEILDLVRSQSTIAQISSITVENAEKDRFSAAVSMLPTLSATASYTHLGEVPLVRIPEPFGALMGGGFATSPQNIKSAGISLSQPIFTGGRLWYAYQSANHALEAQRFSHERTLQEAELSALRLFWGYVSAVSICSTIVQTRTWLEQLVRDQGNLFSIGLIIEHDLLTSKTQLSSVRLDELRAANRAKALADQLSILLGNPVGTHYLPDTSGMILVSAGAMPLTSTQIDSAIAARSDMKAFDAQIEQLSAINRLQRSAYVPTIGAFYNHSWSNQSSGNEDRLDPNWNTGVALSWNILDWGKSWVSMKQTEARIEALRMQRDVVKEQLRAAMRELSRRVEESRLALEISAEGVTNASRALELANVRYQENMITNTELLTTGKELAIARANMIGAKIEAMLAFEEQRIGPAVAVSSSMPAPSATVPMQSRGQGPSSGGVAR